MQPPVDNRHGFEVLGTNRPAHRQTRASATLRQMDGATRRRFYDESSPTLVCSSRTSTPAAPLAKGLGGMELEAHLAIHLDHLIDGSQIGRQTDGEGPYALVSDF